MSDKPSYLADFDSASAMLSALGRFLHGRDFPMLGAVPPWAMPAVKGFSAMVNQLPPYAHRLLASTLPAAHVLTAPGGHRWPVWQELWMQFLRRHIAADVHTPRPAE